MWNWAAAGAVLVAAGAWKFNETLAAAGRAAQLADFLAFRCAGSGEGAALQAMGHGPALQAAMHCWGCPAMAVGAAFLLLSAWASFSRSGRAAFRNAG